MIKTLIVHLQSNKARYQHITGELNKQGIDDYEIIPAVIGAAFKPANNIIACLHSHRNACKRVAELNQPVLILEDDAMLDDCFVASITARIAALPKTFDIAFVGYTESGINIFNTVFAGWKTKQGHQAIHAITFYGAWAYIVNGKTGAEKLLAMNESNADYPFFDVMARNVINSGAMQAYWLSFPLSHHGKLPSTLKHWENDKMGYPINPPEAKTKPASRTRLKANQVKK